MARTFRPYPLGLSLLLLAGCIPGPRVEQAPRPVPRVPRTSPPPASAPVQPPPSPSILPPSQQPVPDTSPLPAAIQPTPPPASTTPSWLARPVTPDAVTIAGKTYIVKPGDTLSRISMRTGASMEAIARENGLSAPFVVKAGKKLAIPGGRYHLVKRGESGIAIARAYGIDWSNVATMNHLEEPYILREGQRLLLPSQAETASMSVEQRAEAFQLDIDDIVTGGEPALAENAKPVPPVGTPARTLSPNATVAAPGTKFDGQFAWPVDGKIIRSFGALGDGRRNDGINIAAAQGTPIYAAADGVVAYVGSDVAIYGGLVLVRHGEGWLTAYGHAERLTVSRGQSVRKGQLIGYIGQAGLADQDQLHFEVRQGRVPVDPRLHLPKRG